MVRLFIAIDAEGAEQECLRLQELILQKGIKPTKHFHITMQFLGDVDEAKILKLTEDLHAIQFEPFTFQLDKLTVFDANQLRIIHLGIQPMHHTIDLQKQIAEKTSWIEEKREFVPHITLGRVKERIEAKPFLNKIKDIEVEPITVRVNRFRLYKSTLTTEGPEYEIVAEFLAQPL